MTGAGGMRGRIFVGLQYLLPQHAISRLVHLATRVRVRWFKNLLTRGFLLLFPVDMSEAAQPDPFLYGTFNEFFTRALAIDPSERFTSGADFSENLVRAQARQPLIARAAGPGRICISRPIAHISARYRKWD